MRDIAVGILLAAFWLLIPFILLCGAIARIGHAWHWLWGEASMSVARTQYGCIALIRRLQRREMDDRERSLRADLGLDT